MARYFLTQKAIDDLSAIWEYTFETWSEHQADSYYFALVEDCQKLADRSYLGRNYHEIRADVFGYKSSEHLIFYRKMDQSNIEVIRILHARMDLKKKNFGVNQLS
jgi:toxin ParE1/3/4